MELLLKTPKLLAEIIENHTPGLMKIAPEHTVSKVLDYMHKPGFTVLDKFLKLARSLCGKKGKKTGFSAYLIASHPGCKIADMHHLVADLQRCKLQISQFQDFTPTPGTIATAMYVSGKDRTGKKIHIPSANERLQQRKILEKAMNVNSPKKGRR